MKGKGAWFESLAKEQTTFFPGESHLRVCRPLKEFVPKEVYYYLHSNDLTKYVITRTNFSVHASKKVANLPGRGNFTLVMDDFLNKLQDDFPSTIFTVLKTSEKIKVDKVLAFRSNDKEVLETHCKLCKGFIDTSNILECGFDHCLIDPEPANLTMERLQKTYNDHLTDFEKILCHACKKLMNYASDSKLLEDVLSKTL